jgi:hypothetical protein
MLYPAAIGGGEQQKVMPFLLARTRIVPACPIPSIYKALSMLATACQYIGHGRWLASTSL